MWLLYLTTTSNFLFGSLVFAIVLWGAIGIVAAIAAAAFLARYARRP